MRGCRLAYRYLLVSLIGIGDTNLVSYTIGYFLLPFSDIHTESDIRDLSVSHPLLFLRSNGHTDGKFAEHSASLTQSERLEMLQQLASASLSAFEEIGLPVFLTSGTLLGHFRHSSQWLPWEDDVDLGLDSSTCERLFVGRSLREEFLRHMDASRFQVSTGPRGSRMTAVCGWFVNMARTWMSR